MTIERISKIDVACRHLDTAIALWFQESDPVSIHLLACASHQIIHDVIHSRGGDDPLFDSPYIKPEFKAKAKKAFHQHYNFLKHADREPEASMEFDSSAPQYFIIFSAIGLEQLGIKNNLLRFAFFLYFGFHNPEFMGEDGFKSFAKDFHIEIIPELKLPRRDFFQTLQQGLLPITR
jgi:hypothetical protein